MESKQLSLIEDFYAEDKRKGEILEGLKKFSRNTKWVYGLLSSMESSVDMFSSEGKRINEAIDQLEYVVTALAMVVYDEISDVPELKGITLDEISKTFCKLELIGMTPPTPSKEYMVDSSYTLPTILTKVSDKIESKRSELLLSELMKFIVKVEEI